MVYFSIHIVMVSRKSYRSREQVYRTATYIYDREHDMTRHSETRKIKKRNLLTKYYSVKEGMKLDVCFCFHGPNGPDGPMTGSSQRNDSAQSDAEKKKEIVVLRRA